jgi:hypothetical protein
MKTRRKPKRRFTAPPLPTLSEEQRLALAPLLLRRFLYAAKVVPNPDNPSAVAKYLAEELRIFPLYGARSLARIVERRWNDKHFVPRMLKALGKCLKDGQPVFDKVDYAILNIVVQHLDFVEHLDYTIKEITAELSEQYPNTKWDTLEKRVRRLLKNVPGLL